MKSRWVSYAMPVIAACFGVAFLIVVVSGRNRNTVIAPTGPGPQCAHWAVFRSAQLLGIPTEPGEIQRLLPNQPKGHSMAQVVETLAKVGLKAEGFRDDWNSLATVSFPCIVHLAEPDHYIVVSGMEPERGFVHIFDDAGNRTRQQRDTFEKRWTGYSLHLAKNSESIVKQEPKADYAHLILDKGDIPAVGEPVEFAFPIKNSGSSDLVVEDVKVNCGCLKSEKPTEPIVPGESGIVKLFYTIEPKRGVFSQTAAVKTNDPENPVVVITACGFTGVEVRIEPSKVVLDRLFLGRECPYQCFIRYTGEWGDFQVDVESNDLSGIKLLRQECITLDEANISSTLAESQGKTKISDSVSRNNRVLALTFEPTGKLSETVSGSIVLKTNVPSYERFTLRVSGTIKSPVQAFPGTIDLADGEEHQVTLVSLVDEPLHVTGIDCDDAITCRHTASVTEKEQTLYFKQTGKPTSNQLNVKFRLNSEESETTLPLTLIDHAF